ncbi:unnamed protein product [Closterium sp. NIES-54]
MQVFMRLLWEAGESAETLLWSSLTEDFLTGIPSTPTGAPWSAMHVFKRSLWDAGESADTRSWSSLPEVPPTPTGASWSRMQVFERLLWKADEIAEVFLTGVSSTAT